MGMLARAVSVRSEMRSLAGELDADCLASDDAAALFEVFADIEKLGAAGKALTARRVADTGLWRVEGERSPAHWMARRAGTTIGSAVAVLETAQHMADLPVLDEAYRDGRLSQVQAQEIASSAAANPATQRELLAAAASHGVKGLRDACRRVAAAEVGDECSRHQAIHRGRYLRSWLDADGAGRLDARLTADALATVLAGLERFENLEFEAARSQGRHEPYHAYTADAFVAMAQAALAGPDGVSGGPSVVVHAVISHSALVRGHTVAGETCHIAGVGPVPVATVRAMMADAFLAAVVTDGVDVYTVAHTGRTVTAHQRTALTVRDPECVVPGCHVDHHLEIDHVEPWAVTRTTKLDRLARLCKFHHHQKTYEGYRLEGRPGHWLWLHPDRTPA